MKGPLLPVLLLWCGMVLLAALSRDHGRTAWNPHPHGLLASLRYDLRLLTPTVSIAGVCVLALLLLDRMAVNLHMMRDFWGLPAMLSVQVLLVCALSGRIGNLRQRAAMGLAEEHLPAVVWAAIGPGLTLLGLGILMAAQEPGAEAALGAPTLMPWHRPALVLATVLWAWGLWRPRLPSAVLCSWHEVLPRGSDVAVGQGAVPGFEHPPDGALRLNAWATRDTGRVIYWPVPVRDLSWNPLARLPELRAETRATPGPHLLGEAAFEQEKWNRRAQTTRITIRPIPGRRKALGEHAQAVLIRPNRAQITGSEDRKREIRSWSWQDVDMQKRVRVLSEESVHLLDGDVIILSADGVATAWRLEFGPLLLPGDTANQLVLPILNAGEKP